MDLFIALLSLPLLMFIIFKLLRNRSTSSNSPLNLIPGPRKLPIIGNLHLLLGNSPLHHVCRDLALKHGPLFRLQLGEIPFLIASSVEVAEQVLKTHDQVFANRPDLGFTANTVTYNSTNIGLAPYGDYWRHLRKICTLELLSTKRVRLFRPIREEENANLCRWFAENEGAPVNLSERVYMSSFDITTRAAVGVKSEDGESVSSAFKEVMKLALGFTVADIFPSIAFLPLISGIKFKLERIFGKTDRILDDVIEQRRAAAAAAAIDGGKRAAEDLVDVLLKYQDDGAEIPLTTDNVKAVLMDMFLAGTETSATVIDWAMSEMIKNPTTLKKAQEEVRKVFDDKGCVDEAQFEELKYLKLVIKETMRLHPPLPLVVPRQNSQRCEISRYEIPAKTSVIINSWALGRDPKHWNDADNFMPGRFQDSSIDYKGNNIEYIPFGAGRRMCPGMSFGAANVESALAMLLYHFDWKMPDGIKNEELDMTEDLGTTVKRKQDLLVIPIFLFIALLSLPLLIFLVLKLLKRKSNTSSNSLLNLIPGPRKLPIVGNLHLFLGNSPLHHVFRDLSLKYGPLFRLQLGEIPFLIVSSVEVAEQVLKTHDQVFANRPDLGFTAKAVTYNRTNIGLSPYGDYWRHLRKICTLELLSMRRVRLFRPIREEENLNLCNGLAENEGSPANLSERVYMSSFDITTRAAVGNKTEDQESVSSAVKEVMKLGSGFTIADLFPSVTFLPLVSGMKSKIDRIFGKTDRMLDDIINYHRADNAAGDGAEDLVDVLLKYQHDGAEIPLTIDNVKAVIMDMFFAGGETSATVIEWAMSEMIKNPTTLKKAQEEVRRTFDDKGYVDEAQFEELKYLKLVIKEAMRLHPPLPLVVPRQNSQRCEINGYEIPAQTRVIVNSWALGRDPKYWNDADKFIPERFQDSSIDFKGNNIEYIPFGAGRRMCPGMSFGLANVESTLAMLLYHFDWNMPNGIKNEELDMTEDLGTSVKRKQDLLLIPIVVRPLKVVE